MKKLIEKNIDVNSPTAVSSSFTAVMSSLNRYSYSSRTVEFQTYKVPNPSSSEYVSTSEYVKVNSLLVSTYHAICHARIITIKGKSD